MFDILMKSAGPGRPCSTQRNVNPNDLVRQAGQYETGNLDHEPGYRGHTVCCQQRYRVLNGTSPESRLWP